MPNQTINNNSDQAITMQTLQNLQRNFQTNGFNVDIMNTNSPEAKVLSIKLPTQRIAFKSLIHFDDEDQHENTLEDGKQVVESLQMNADALSKKTGRQVTIDLDTLKRDISRGGFNIYQGHVYVETNQAYFFRDLFNLAQVIIYTYQNPKHYLKL